MRVETTTKLPFNVVLWSVVALFIINILGNVCGAIFYVKSLNDVAVKDLEKRIEVSIGVEQYHLKRSLVEYSYWDETYKNAVLNIDDIWIERNIGEYAIKSFGLAVSAVIDGAGNIFVQKTDDGRALFDKKSINELGLAKAVARSKESTTVSRAIGGYACVGDSVYMFALAPLIDEATKHPREDDTYLLFAKRINSEYIDSVSRLYQLPRLHITSGDRPDAPYYLLLDNPKCPQVWIYSVAPQVNWTVLSILLPVVILLALLTVSLSWLLLHKHNEFRRLNEQKLYNLAVRDPLTGVYNRRQFTRLGADVFARYDDIAVVMLDIDHFKSINDQFGHAAGDKVLRLFADSLTYSLRETDIIGRLGGEEFAALLVKTDIKEASKVAERVRARTEALSVEKERSIPPITVSIGISFARKGKGFEDVLHEADEALYCAKKKGRNQVVVASESKDGGKHKLC